VGEVLDFKKKTPQDSSEAALDSSEAVIDEKDDFTKGLTELIFDINTWYIELTSLPNPDEPEKPVIDIEVARVLHYNAKQLFKALTDAWEDNMTKGVHGG